MPFTSAKYEDQGHTMVLAQTDDGRTIRVSVSPNNALYKKLLAEVGEPTRHRSREAES